MAAMLSSFLRTHRAAKGDPWTLTGMGSDVGTYMVAPDEYDTFLSLYSQHVLQDRCASSLLERHGTFSPVLIDLDFRYAADTKERCFDETHVERWLKDYAAAFFHFFEHTEPLRFFVMFRPELTAEKEVVKDGVHIICGDLTLPYSVLKTLRKYTLEKRIMATFSDLTNSDDDAFDEAVIQRNNWFLYGSGKPGRAAYAVDYCYLCHSDGRVESVDWEETDAEFVRLFSLQYGRDRPTELLIRSDIRDEWTMWESIACPGAQSIVPKTSVGGAGAAGGAGRDDESVCSHLSDGIAKILKNSNFVWTVEACESGYKLIHDKKDCLVMDGTTHDQRGHSCLYVHRSHATLMCFSHKTKSIARGKATQLWKLLAQEEDDHDQLGKAYAERKTMFETRNFRVLNPPGYMTCIDDTWVHYTRQQLIDMNSGIFLDDAKKERFVDWWLKDEHIRTYSRIGYFVDAAECPTSVYNTFRGFAAARIDPDGSSIDRVLNHIRVVLADGDEAVYEFLLDWLASVIQRPRRLTGICLVVLGQHGAGKDILFNWFGSKIVGMDTYYKTARPHHDMFGPFNSTRRNRVFYHVEEGNAKAFAGEYIEQFKNFITDEFASIQLKGKDTFAVEVNYNHFVVSSNHAVPFEIHRDERRFFAVRASNRHVRDNDYFTMLLECLETPGVARSFYDMLMSRDLSGRDWKNPPPTEALTEWKHSCESEIVQFLEHFRTAHPDVTAIKSSDMYAVYKDYCREFRQEAMKLRRFGMEIKRLLGQATHMRSGEYYTINYIEESTVLTA